ncbi:histidine kinase dimerization/phospho-acceptor domain-containing protein [Erythrobacteraceae bacterium WH01K]|nr:histidine kinase dimerization/phospho-acceptor domain-containing protein [Erythrobacteraceae bacterium WH01K]
MRLGHLGTRALEIILPIGLLLFGISTWVAYDEARSREIGSALSALREDRTLAGRELQSRFAEIEAAQQSAIDRMERELAGGGIAADAGGDEIARLDRAFDDMESRVTRERLRLTQSFDLLVGSLEEHAVLLLDAEGRITRANRAATQVYGWDASSNLGLAQVWAQVGEPGAGRGAPAGGAAATLMARELLAQVAQEGRVSRSNELRGGQGRIFWAEEAIEAITDNAGKLTGSAYIARDISQQKAAEDALLAARDDARNAAENRKTLLATVSHEIRTPMTGILGMLEQVRQDNSARTRSGAGHDREFGRGTDARAGRCAANGAGRKQCCPAGGATVRYSRNGPPGGRAVRTVGAAQGRRPGAGAGAA